METLEDARKWEKNYPDQVKVYREVRYYARVNGVRYELYPDWTLQELEKSIWEDNTINKLNKE